MRGWRADALSDTERLLLRAAGLREAEGASAAWRSFRERVREGDEQKGERRLLPLVCRNLLKLGHPKDPFLAREYAQSFGATARMVGEVAPALQALHRASIPAMVLKGTALALTHYRDMGARPMSDVDILVPEDRIVDALDLLKAAGFQGNPSREWLETESHADTLTAASGTCIDLHRHATYEARFRAADQAFFADAVSLEVAGAPALAMNPGDQLLHILIHGLRWSIARSPMWVVDAATILRGGGVDVEKTVARAASLRFVVPLERGLETVRDILGEDEALTTLLLRVRAERRTVADRVEHWSRVREPAGIVGALPNLWFAYRRSDGEPTPVSGFPTFLSKVWRLGPEQSLGRLLLAKIRRRLS